MAGPPSRWTPTVRYLLLCLALTSTASMLLTTVLFKQVYDISGRELDLGLVGLFEFAPAALLVLVAGSIADRFDRRHVTAISLSFEALMIVGLLLYTGSNPTAVGPIFVLVFCFGVGRALQAPASRSLPADSVPPDQVPWIVARYSMSWQVAQIAGPVIASVLYVVDPRLPYLAVLVLLASAAMFVLRIDAPVRRVHVIAATDLASPDAPPVTDETPGGRWGEAVEGLRFVRRTPILLGAISLDLFAVLFGGAIALLPAIAEDRLGAGAVGYGWLRAATGIGAGAVTLALAARPLARRIGRTLLVSVAVFGLGTIVLGVTRNYFVAFAAILVLSGADAMSVFIRASLTPLVTPRDKRGRVLAVENVFIGASNELGAFESGVAGQLLGPAGAVILGGVASVAIAAGWAARFPDLRDVDRFPESVNT